MSGAHRLTLAAARDGLRAQGVLGRASWPRRTSRPIERQRGAQRLHHRDARAGARDGRGRPTRGSARGEARPLEGMPLAIKDLFCTEGVLTTAGSHILDGFVPPYESTVSRKLWEAGAVLLGKTNLDEFAMGSSNVTCYYGRVRNPWTRAGRQRATLVPGGSSGGSAAAVAARLCLGATGTDTGGSIRQPAALLRHRRHQADLRPLLALGHRRLRVLARPGRADGAHGRGLRDPAAGAWPATTRRTAPRADLPVPDLRPALTGDVRGLRIGIPKEYRARRHAGRDRGALAAGRRLAARRRLPSSVEVSLPHTKYALPAYYIIAPAEASSNLARYDGVRYGLRVEGENLDRHLREDPRRGLRRRGAAARHDRHLRALGRLLRRLLPARRRRSARRSRATSTQAFEQVDCAADADRRPSAAVPHRREDGRPGRDVPERRVHGDRSTSPACPGISVPAGLTPTACRSACR